MENYCKRFPSIRLLHNKHKFVPYALNLGIKESRGDLIIRIDAHCNYADDYFLQIINTFNSVEADIVGGPTRVAPGTEFQNAVASVISNPFGIGNSKVHDSQFRGYTDHVTFGAWRKDLFEQIGYFDERLLRNQDDEFHYRAKSKGKKVYLNPDIKLWYHPRKNFKELFNQYFQYGYYKPLVLKKIKSEIKLRHLVPALFVLYLFTLPLAFISIYWLIPLILYLTAAVVISLVSKTSLKAKLYSIVIYPVLHTAYGLGFLIGLLNMDSK